MQRRNKYYKLIGILGISILSAGCSSNGRMVQDVLETISYPTIGVVMKSNTSEYWMSVNRGMEEAAAQYNMKLLFMAPDSEQDKEVQEKQVAKLIGQEIDAIAVSPIDSYSVPAYMELIDANEIPIVSFDTGFAEWDDVPYIGIDNYQIGYELGRTLAEQLEHQGQVGLVTGDLNQMGHRERAQGFQDYIECEEAMTIAFVESGYANLQMSEQKVKALLTEYPQVKGIMATSAVTALGLADVMKASAIKIVAIDEQEDALDALEKGEISALAAQSGYDIGYQTIEYLAQLCKGEVIEADCYLDAPILTQENVQAYRREHEDQEY